MPGSMVGPSLSLPLRPRRPCPEHAGQWAVMWRSPAGRGAVCTPDMPPSLPRQAGQPLVVARTQAGGEASLLPMRRRSCPSPQVILRSCGGHRRLTFVHPDEGSLSSTISTSLRSTKSRKLILRLFTIHPSQSRSRSASPRSRRDPRRSREPGRICDILPIVFRSFPS
jgi:hypothetical protein